MLTIFSTSAVMQPKNLLVQNLSLLHDYHMPFFSTTGVSAPLWGLFCDRKPPKIASFCGAVLMIVSFAFLGPLPVFHIEKTVPIVSCALIGHGKQAPSTFTKSVVAFPYVSCLSSTVNTARPKPFESVCFAHINLCYRRLLIYYCCHYDYLKCDYKSKVHTT